MLDRQFVGQRYLSLMLLAVTAILSGCTLVYAEEFKNYVYKESEKKRALKSLDFTDAQIEMFDQVFGSLITLVPADAPQRDLFIEPEILEIQYSAPKETKINQYEIWIKYRIKLTDAAGDKIADWIIKGYGKTPTAMLSSAASAFNSATTVALRDVGAQLSIGFPNQSKIKALMGAPDTPPDLTQEVEPAETASTIEEPQSDEVTP